MAFAGQIHASCVARGGAGVVLLGPSGAGKSDLALRLIEHGFVLVADDRVEIAGGIARPAPALAGLIEIRGIGIARLPYLPQVPLALAVTLATAPERLPAPRREPRLDLPLIALETGFAASAVTRIGLALEAAQGRIAFAAGGVIDRGDSDPFAREDAA